MSLLKIALVGRPNVGKSALFNRLCKKRVAIVDAKAGVTRDRLYGTGSYFGVPFEVIDTGGIDTASKDEISRAILEQTERAILEAESLILVVDGHAGVSPLDVQVAERLRKTEKPVVVAVNKIDHLSHESLIHEFHALGISTIVPVSAIQGTGIEELLQHAFKEFPKRKRKTPSFEGARLAIIGRPNVGKSSLINALLAEERCVVSEVAGTTRDKIEIPFTFDGKPYLLIDTAGIRRKKSEIDVVEKFAAIRTQEALERCDICLLVADAQEGITAQEKKVLREIETAGKGCLLLLNKWDLVKGFRMEHCLKGLRMECPSFGNIPTMMISAKTKRNFDQIFPEVEKIAEKFAKKIPTPQLNKFIQNALQLNHPPMLRGKRLRIYYLTQFATRPPKFLLFVNHPDLMCETYKKYLLNLFRDEFGLSGVPIDFVLKGKEPKEK